MKLLYFFDNKIKKYMIRGKRCCNPSETGKYEYGISCIRQNDVNIWFYTKNGVTIAIDAGHLNFQGTTDAFKTIGINSENIKHLFVTHADVDHCGGIDICGANIFPNAKVYLGKDEKVYLNDDIHRMKKFGIKIKNCVKLAENFYPINGDEVFYIEDIKVQAIHTPGHTLGHTCYLIDDKVLFTGDCLAVNDNGGYSFFDFFTQYPDMNKKSLTKLKKIACKPTLKYVCTGHSGIRVFSDNIFSHIGESAKYSQKYPFDDKAPFDVCM